MENFVYNNCKIANSKFAIYEKIHKLTQIKGYFYGK